MNRLIGRFFDIRPEERFRAILLFSYIFLVIASLTVIKPVRNSLFLTRFGASQLPYAYMVVGLAAIIVAPVYYRLTRDIRLHRLIGATTVSSVLILAFFWKLLSQNSADWFLYAFYVWVAIFGIVNTSQVWVLANYIFNAREAKRVFSFIGAGAISGGIAGGYFTKVFVGSVGTINLLWFSIAFLVICLGIQYGLYRSGLQYRAAQGLKKRFPEEMKSLPPALIILRSRHLRYLAAVTGLGVIVAILVDYQFNVIVLRHVSQRDDLTGFLGFWLSNLSVVSLLIQLLITNRVIGGLGLSVSLYVLPVAIFSGALGVIFSPGLWSGIGIKAADGGLKNSIHKASQELLFLPIPSAIKRQVKSFLDITVDNLATGIGGALLLFFTARNLSVEAVAMLTAAIVVLWMYSLLLSRREYVHSLHQAIEKRSVNLEDLTTTLEDASVVSYLKTILAEDDEKKLLYLLDLLENASSSALAPHLELLIGHASPEVRIRALNILSNYRNRDYSEPSKKMVSDGEFDEKVSAIEYLAQHSNDGIAVVERYLDHADPQVQTAAMMCAAKHYSTDPRFLSFRMTERVDEILKRYTAIQDDAGRNDFRLHLAGLIGWARTHDLHQHLRKLLEDPVPEVQREAILSAGRTGDWEFVPFLVGSLGEPSLRKYAREALASYGRLIIPELARLLSSADTDRKLLLQIPGVLERIGTQETVDLLMDSLTATSHTPESTKIGMDATTAQPYFRPDLHSKDLILRFQLLRAASKLRVNFPELKFPRKKIDSEILLETRNYYSILASLHQEHALVFQEGPAVIARKFLVQALREKLDENCQRIFRLLGLRYQPDAMQNAYRGIYSRNPDLRANAIEFLDNVLDQTLKKQILLIAESSSAEELMDRALQDLALEIPSEQECLKSLLQGEDLWLKACALQLVGCLDGNEYREEIQFLAQNPEPVVRETASRLLTTEGSHLIESGGRKMLTTLEKVFILKELDIFQEASTEELAFLASITEQVTVPAGHTFFHEGEIPKAVYVVVTGTVELVSNGKVFLTAGKNNAFGTYFLLEEEPSPATALSTEETTILMIGGEEFFDLLSDNIRMTRSLLKALIKRVRKLVANLPGSALVEGRV